MIPRQVTGRVLVLSLVLFGWAMPDLRAAQANWERDSLVYKDGDRIHGQLVETTAGMIIFESDRFGELRVPEADAVVIKAAPEPAKVPATVAARKTPAKAAASPQSRTPADIEEEEKAARLTVWDEFYYALLTARLRDFFGPWRGRFTFSTEIVSDSANRNHYLLESKLRRKWARDEVQATARYDLAETDQVKMTDVLKASGTWRHDFNKKLFAHYRPSVEWNQASRKKGTPNEYVLLQQELGAGYTFLSTPARKLRAGVSQNLFDVWNIDPTSEHTARSRESIFEELELALPWRMAFAQRGVWYPVSDSGHGIENRVEVNKKLTETLSTAVRHELRRDHPEENVQDFTRLRLLFGIDF